MIWPAHRPFPTPAADAEQSTLDRRRIRELLKDAAFRYEVAKEEDRLRLDLATYLMQHEPRWKKALAWALYPFWWFRMLVFHRHLGRRYRDLLWSRWMRGKAPPPQFYEWSRPSWASRASSSSRGS